MTASGSVELEDQPGHGRNTRKAIATNFAVFAPLPPDQELRVVVEP